MAIDSWSKVRIYATWTNASEITLGPCDFDEILHNCEDLAGLERRVRNQITPGFPA